MNKNRFRVIYSQAQSIFIAVAETVKSRTKAPGQGTLSGDVEVAEAGTSTTYKRLNPLNFAVISCLGAVLISMPLNSMANSQIVADKSAPNNQQATILNSGNGLVQVNIQTPSAGGVSRNTYTQFDVGQEGAILNNSRNNAQTQIGGWVQGNPWLAKGEAKVILNEVNSSNPSQLKGYLEVAGKQAQVVIANPSGLVCEGCGVINATRFTLTTGQAVMNQGYLESFRVREGQVTIAGKGLDGSLTPFTDIYSRALTVNAGLYANSLSTVLGQNDINVQDPSTPQINTATTNLNNLNTSDNNKPNFALDVGQLGGMYAGKIFLVGTEKGLGVRNAGSINATSQQLTLTANGDLLNAGNIIANKEKIELQAHHVENSGNISSTQQQIKIQADEMNNSGLLASNDEIKLNIANKINNDTGVINAGRIDFTAQSLSNKKGKIEQTGQQDLNLIAKSLDNTQGKIGATLASDQGTGNGQHTGETVPPTVGEPDKTSTAKDDSKVTVAPPEVIIKQFSAGEIRVTNDINNTEGQITSNRDVSLKIQEQIKNTGGELRLGQFEFVGQALDNQQGQLYAKTIDLQAQQLNNQKGLIAVQQQLNLNVQQLNNAQGALQSAKDLSIQAKDLDNKQGKIFATEKLNITATRANNQEGAIASIAGQANLDVQQLDNQKGEISAETLKIQADQLGNQQGQLLATTQASITANSLDNVKGTIAANKQVNIDVKQLNNTTGMIRSKQDQVQINSQSEVNNTAGEIYAGTDLKLNVAGLNNQQGTMVAEKSLQMDTQQQSLKNTQGQLVADEIKLLTGTLNNQSGTIIAKKSVDIDTQQHDLINTQAGDKAGIFSQGTLNIQNVTQLDNSQGYISAADQTKISAQLLRNQAGEISSQKDLEIAQVQAQGVLDNNLGKILAEKNLSLNVDQITNQGKSLISSGEILQINSTQLDNQLTQSAEQSGIHAKNIVLNTQVLNNQTGMISAREVAQLDIKQQLNNQKGHVLALDQVQLGQQDKTLNIDNTGGEILAKNKVDIQANALLNQGKIISEKDVDIQLKQNYLHDKNSEITANNQLKLSTEKDLINQSNLTAGKLIDISAQNIQNQKEGTIYSEQTHLNAKDTVHNQGLINGELTHIQANRVWNDGARIYGTKVAIQAKALDNLSDATGQGAVIASRSDMHLAVGTLNNQASGAIKDSAKDNAWIISQGDLTIAGELDDQLNAKGRAEYINNNSARIESLGNMEITAVKVDNINSNFDTTPVQVGDIVEKTYIQPEGTSAKILSSNLIWQDWSRAGFYRYNTDPVQLPDNVVLGETPIPGIASGTCDGEGPLEQCKLNYKKDDPVWAYFKITPPTLDMPKPPTAIAPVEPTGKNSCEVGAGFNATVCQAYQTAKAQYDLDKKKYDQIVQDYQTAVSKWEAADESAYELLGIAIEQYNAKFGGNEIKTWWQYDVKEKTLESQVTKTTPGEIISGGNMHITADWLTNDKSQILAGGQLKTTLANDLITKEGDGVRIVNVTGESYKSTYRWRGGFKRYYQRTTSDYSDYNPADVPEPLTLVVSKSLGNIQNHTLNTQIDQVQTQNNNKIQTGQTDQPTVDGRDQGGQPNISGGQVDQANQVRSIDLNALKISSNALFSTHGDTKAQYFVESDPNFTNYKQWLSTDYMLKSIGLDPKLQQKRLGDGYYEQRLVQDQIAQLTGRRFLKGYANDEEQFKALMNNGLSFAKNYNLTPGIALTAAQIAQLTSDIVWIEAKQVQLADGTSATAWVPQVYVRARSGDLKGDGSLISAEQVDIQVKGGVVNGATIAGREIVKISADHIDQMGGRIESNLLDLQTRKDFNNQGGTIVANQAARLDIGGDFNHNTTTVKTENIYGQNAFTREGVARKAGLYVGGDGLNTVNPDLNTTLSIRVGGQANIKGAEIVNQNGATAVQAQGDLNIGSVKQEVSNSGVANSRNYNKELRSQDIGSVISSKGDLNLKGQNVQIQGSQLSSQSGNTVIQAVKDIKVTEGRSITATDQADYMKSKGLLSSSSEQNYNSKYQDQAVASSIEGKKVIIDANNVAIRGSDVVSDDLTQITAKENISITAAENHSQLDSRSEVKKSGFTASLSDGVASVGYAKSSQNNQSNSQSTILTQSVINSQGDTTIIAGKDLTAQAAILNAGKDLNLQGANVSLTAGYETNNQHSEMQSKKSGIAVGMTYSPAEAAASTYQKNMKDNQYSDSAVGKVMAHGEAVGKAGMAAQTPIVLTASNQKTNRTQDSSSSQAVVTQASAKGGNLNIIATEGNINSQGAQLSAEGDALLHAKDTINLSFATDHQDQSAKSQTKGFSVDNRDWSAPAGIYNNKEKGQAQLDKVTGTQLSVGGKTKLQTEKGDINILGSSVAGQGDVNIHAARDVNIKSTQNSQSQSESSTNKGIGSAQISDTEKFFGYMKGGNQSNSQSVEQQRSQVGSLGGSVNIVAGNNYTQQVADVVANKDISITAKQIKVLDDHNTSSAHQSSDDLKVGVFAKVSSPILDAIGAVDKAANSKADDRTQALQTLAAGAQTYQTYSDVQGGALFKAEAGIGFSTKNNKQDSYTATSQQNHITAGGNVNLTSTEGDIHLQNTQVKAKDTINLDSAQHIVLESGQSQQRVDGKNSNAGLSVGYGVSVGAQTGAYIYGEAGIGKGSNHLDSNTHNLTTLESDRLNIKSKGDTTLTGAKATANRIDADVGGKLRIESLQDQTEQNIKQTGAGGRVQASLGTAWQASGNFSQSKAQGSSSSVDQQSGLFAGEGGYHVKADSVDLKGGAIASTAAKDKNDLTTNRFTFSNVENKSQYDTTTVSLSGGTSLGGGKAATGDGKASTPTNNDNWRNATSFSPSLPQHKSDQDSSTTYATLSDGNITIGGKKTTVEQLGIHTDINTANHKVDTLPNLQNILDNQKTVADATSTIVAATRTYSQNQQAKANVEKQAKEQVALDELKAQGGADWDAYQNLETPAAQEDFLKSKNTDYKTAAESAQAWGIGGSNSRALNAVTMAITGALGGQTDLQVATNSLSPYAAQLIGEQWGHGEDKNTAAQLTAHAILGATLAYVNGANPAVGGSAAVAAEYAADYFSQKYNDGKTAINPETGQFDPNLLPENVKSSIRDLTSAIGAVVGGTVGDSAFNAQLAGVVGQNAVENNTLFQDYAELASKGKTRAQMAKEYVDAERKRSCGAVGLSANSEACSQHVRKETLQAASDGLGVVSNGATGAGVFCLYAVACSEFSPGLFTIGKFSGWGSTALDTEKSLDQKTLEVIVSGVTGKASEKGLSNVSEINYAVKKTHEEISGKLGEKAVETIYKCNANPNLPECKKK